MPRRARWPLLLVLALLSGCAGHRMAIEKALRQGKSIPPTRDLEGQYVIHCPDNVEVAAPLRPELEGTREVRPDGCILLANGTAIEVAGMTAPEAARVISRRMGCQVSCKVAKHESQHIFLVDPRGATQRAVPYRGPESVVEFLRRVEGLEGASLEKVQVVRAHVADGKPPEVFEVDLGAILLKADAQTDVRLMPFDRVYVAQTKEWRFCSCLPPWMRPLYRRLTGEKAEPVPGPGSP